MPNDPQYPDVMTLRTPVEVFKTVWREAAADWTTGSDKQYFEGPVGGSGLRSKKEKGEYAREID